MQALARARLVRQSPLKDDKEMGACPADVLNGGAEVVKNTARAVFDSSRGREKHGVLVRGHGELAGPPCLPGLAPFPFGWQMR